MKEIKQFDVGTNEEFRAAGMNAANWEPPELDLANVPESLHDLVPLVRRFGVPCDVTRHDVAEGASEAELAEVAAKMKGREHELEDLIFDPAYDDYQHPWTNEAYHFNALITFAVEECDYEGTSSFLAYCIRKFKEAPSEETLTRLRHAYTQGTRYASRGVPQQSLDKFVEAKALLKKRWPEEELPELPSLYKR